jgi:cytochrome b subunit of formate dehydrogenase
MDPLQWAIDPWGKIVPIHIAWFLIWVAAIAGLLFVIVHAIFVRYFAKPRQFEPAAPVDAAKIPAHVPRHSLVARAFHWIMAASMFTLLFTAFLPKIGFQFDWVTYHWIAGAVLTASVLFHIFHASFFLDFWSIWPDKIDLRDAWRRTQRFMGKSAPPPERFAKYPLENKLYHAAIIAAGLSAIVTGVFMMSRVRTIFFFPQSLSVQRHDLGNDVCAARTGRGRIVHVDHGARLLRNSAGEAPDHAIDDFWLDEP